MSDLYEWADNLINSSPDYSTGLTELLGTQPYFVSRQTMQQYQDRLATIRKFQETSISLFREVLRRNRNGRLLKWLINETPFSLGLEFHRKLNDFQFTPPVFFRTDEVSPGLITEIQCPGSIWGELQLTFNYAKVSGFTGNEKSPADKFVSQLTDYLNAPPVIHHLLDNSSAPSGMRYFIESTRPAIKYWGIDKGIKPGHCNFIRSHSFFGLCADNDFRSRLADAGKKIVYDLPPNILFDQKATLVLPFWSATRHHFSDDIRNILLYSTPLLPSGIELPDGSRMTISEFSRLPCSKRNYYLKYAGSDVSINWGAKAVFRLSNIGSERCLELLNKCLSEFKNGRIWLLQEEKLQDDEIEWLDRKNSVRRQVLRAKFSGIFRPRREEAEI